MCTFVMVTVPRDVDLNRLDLAIPAYRKRRLMGRLYNQPEASLFAFDIIDNPAVESQLPSDDRLVRFTKGAFCCCPSTLVWNKTPCRKEVAAWTAILYEMLRGAGRVGLLIHGGDPWSDAFLVRGPDVVSLSSPESLYGVQDDTYYEVLD